MKSFRIDTFEMDDGRWKAAGYECGRFIGERTADTEYMAIAKIGIAIAADVKGPRE